MTEQHETMPCSEAEDGEGKEKVSPITAAESRPGFSDFPK